MIIFTEIKKKNSINSEKKVTEKDDIFIREEKKGIISKTLKF